MHNVIHLETGEYYQNRVTYQIVPLGTALLNCNHYIDLITGEYIFIQKAMLNFVIVLITSEYMMIQRIILNCIVDLITGENIIIHEIILNCTVDLITGLLIT